MVLEWIGRLPGATNVFRYLGFTTITQHNWGWNRFSSGSATGKVSVEFPSFAMPNTVLLPPLSSNLKWFLGISTTFPDRWLWFLLRVCNKKGNLKMTTGFCFAYTYLPHPEHTNDSNEGERYSIQAQEIWQLSWGDVVKSWVGPAQKCVRAWAMTVWPISFHLCISHLPRVNFCSRVQEKPWLEWNVCESISKPTRRQQWPFKSHQNLP